MGAVCSEIRKKSSFINVRLRNYIYEAYMYIYM